MYYNIIIKIMLNFKEDAAMKKMLSLMLSVVMLLLSFQITIFAEENDNLLTDAGFESGTLR